MKFVFLKQKEETVSAETVSADTTPYLIVGLGNPGQEYRHNRHNIGFMAVDRLAQHYHLLNKRVEQKAIVTKGKIGSHTVILAKPQTFMNKSGESVAPLLRYYKVPTTHLLVIYDELDLPFGALRLRGQGSPGGHNGMRSIIQQLGGDQFPRLRLGIGRPPGKQAPSSYVLEDFLRDELSVVDELLTATEAAILTFLNDGIELAMTRHNQTGA